MIPPGIRLGVAVSGGADSVFLLRYLAEHSNANLLVLHVNHGLRGAEADADEAFVQELASALGVEMKARRILPPGRDVEQACRRARHSFFNELRADGQVDRIATGHTRSDQAETVLLRLTRGAGTGGIRGILPVTREGVIRPLLDVSGAEVRAWLRGRNYAWREDGTNALRLFARNRIRHEVMPVLRGLNPEAEAALARAATLAGDEEEYWAGISSGQLGAIGRPDGSGWVIDAVQWAALDPALGRRVLREALRQVRGGLRGLDAGALERVEELARRARGEGEAGIPGAWVRRSHEWLRLDAERNTGDPGTWEFELDVPGEARTPGGWVRLWAQDPGSTCRTTALDAGRLRPPFRVRRWRDGDRWHGAGRESEQKLKIALSRARIPSWDRPFVPILTDVEGIVWIGGLGASARAAVSAATKDRIWAGSDRVFSK